MNAASLTEFRDKLSEILDDVASTASEWTVTRNGRPVAVVLNVDEYESLLESLNILSDDDAMAAIAEAEDDIAHGRTEEL